MRVYVLVFALCGCGRLGFGAELGPASDPDAAEPAPPPRPLDIPAGLVARFAMDDDPAGGAIAAEEARLDGRCTSCPTTADGVFGGGYYFDGNQHQHFTIPSADLVGARPFTVAVWLQPDVQPDYASVVSKALDATSGNNAVNLELFGTQPSFETTNLALYVDYVGSAGKSLDDDAWHLVAATWDGATKRLFVDGLLREAKASDLLDSDILVEVGADRDAGSPTGFYRGAMDELEFYDRALTAQEIGILSLHR